MAKKKKPESMIARQRRLLREQRERKAAAKKALEKAAKAPKQLPSKGKSTASSNRAKVQRGLRRDRLARQQLENFGRAVKKTLKQGAAQSKLDKAAKGTKGTTVRTAQGKGDLVTRTSNLPASQRVEKVKVKVDSPKQLSPAKTKTTPALPKGKTQLEGEPSAKRAQAAARANRAAQGTTNPNVRTGQPAGASNRYYGADRMDKVVKRAQRSAALRSAKGRGGIIGTALMGATAIAADQGLLGKKVQDSWQEWNSRTDKILDDKFLKPGKKDKKSDKPKVKYDRRGRPIPVKPAKRGMSNIPVAEQYVNNPNYSKPGKVSKKVSKEVKPAGKVSAASSPKPKQPAPKKPTLKEAAYAKDARNKEYDRLRKAGKIKEAAALGKKIAADARKKAPKNPFRAPQGKERKDRFSRDVAALKAMRPKKKKEPQSRAQRAGWQNNLPY